MKILAIETSCDETGIAIVESVGKRPDFKVLANVTASQIELHRKYGGVFPMMAKREHAKNLIPLLKKALNEADLLKKGRAEINTKKIKKLKKILEREPELCDQFLKFIPKISKPEIDAIAVTHGPGLEPALWVGVNFARALSDIWNMPIIPVNHMEGHILAAFIDEKEFSIPKFKFPAIALLISGGHTELVLMKKMSDYKVIGETRDDAAGEAFDKVARLLGLPYPGGPEISMLAKKGALNPEIALPRPMLNSDDFDFSFSGLKTAVLYLIKKIPKLTDSIKADIALEFEKSVTEVLIKKTLSAISKHKAKTLILGGGVAANERIRKEISRKIVVRFHSVNLYLPSKKLTTDNALMIAVSGYVKSQTKKARRFKNLRANGNLRLS